MTEKTKTVTASRKSSVPPRARVALAALAAALVVGGAAHAQVAGERPQGRDLGSFAVAARAIELLDAVTVPATAGLPVEQAALAVNGAGLTSRLIPLGDAPGEDEAHRVERSEPSAGTLVGPGAPVALFAYGRFQPPDLDAGTPQVAARGAWDQLWRGEMRLTSFSAGGRRMDVGSAIRQYGEWEKDPILSMPTENAISTVDALLIDAGPPVSFALVEEEDGFRLAVPGEGGLVGSFNRVIKFVPLLLPSDDGVLRGRASHDTDNGTVELVVEAAAAPDWSDMTLIFDLVVPKRPDAPANLPATFEFVLEAALHPGLYDPEALERDFFEHIMAAVVSHMPREAWSAIGETPAQAEAKLLGRLRLIFFFGIMMLTGE